MKRITVNLSEDLSAILEAVMKRERYRSPSEAVASFIRHWALSQQPHALTGPWAHLNGFERDELDRQLWQLVDSGKGKKGSWLKARIYDAIKDALGKDAKSPTVEQVLSILPETARAELEREFP